MGLKIEQKNPSYFSRLQLLQSRTAHAHAHVHRPLDKKPFKAFHN